ncbi:MAG TPA: hypothetical protein VGM06_02305 [Polyangiaceae bacterium]
MNFFRTTFRPMAIATAATFGASILLAPVREARADNVSPTGKGITGGALLGAEAVTIVESLAGVRPGWAYGVGAIAGAGAGGVGGYFVEHGNTDGRAPMYMLAGGLALIIPAIVLTLNATRYMPEEGATEDAVPTAQPAEPGTPAGGVGNPSPDLAAPPPPSTPAPTTEPAPPPPAPPQSRFSPNHAGKGRQLALRPSLFDVREGGFRLGVPVPDVLAVFSVAEQRQYGMRSETELRLPVLHVAF